MPLYPFYLHPPCYASKKPPPQCQCQTVVISLPRHSPTFVHIRKKKDLSSSNFFGSNSFQDKKGLRKVWHNFAYKSFACVLARVEISRSLNCITFFPELFFLAQLSTYKSKYPQDLSLILF